jgi:hypothetical protein
VHTLRVQGTSVAKSSMQVGKKKMMLRQHEAGELAWWDIDLGWEMMTHLSLPPDLEMHHRYYHQFPYLSLSLR